MEANTLKPAADRPFVVAPINLRELARSGGGYIPVAVWGYWSHDPITIRVSHEFNWQRGADVEECYSWKVTLSHSSGGRDEKAVPDDLEAEANFGAALVYAAAVARSLRGREAEFEAWYAEARAERRAAEAAAEAAKQARIDADPALGEAAAAALLADAELAAAEQANAADWNGEKWARINVVNRGAASPTDPYAASELMVRYRPRTGRTAFLRYGRSLPRKEALALLAEASARSHLSATE